MISKATEHTLRAMTGLHPIGNTKGSSSLSEARSTGSDNNEIARVSERPGRWIRADTCGWWHIKLDNMSGSWVIRVGQNEGASLFPEVFSPGFS